MSNSSSPDDLSELLDDIESVSEIEDGLVSVDGADYQDSFDETRHNPNGQSDSNYQGFTSNPPQQVVYENSTYRASQIRAHHTAELLSSILSSISSSQHNISDVGLYLSPSKNAGMNNNFIATKPSYFPKIKISTDLFHHNYIKHLSINTQNTKQENSNNPFQNPKAICANMQNSLPKSQPAQNNDGNKESQEKISIINNFIDWEKLKPALMDNKKSRKTTQKPQEAPKTKATYFLSVPVKICLSDIKKFQRALKRSRKTTKTIQEWDRLMGLKKCHSRTMTKSCTSRKKLLEIMQDIIFHAKGEGVKFVATKAV
ncbi:hypothetical protein ACHAXS_007107 [Conticribra weissflogii]